MRPDQFQAWRRALGLTQAEAAKRLGVSSRSIHTYEGTGPVPTAVALACQALSGDLHSNERMQELVRQQHADIGPFSVILPIAIRRGRGFAKVIGASQEFEAWLTTNMPKARFSMRAVVANDLTRWEVPVVEFDNQSDPMLFTTFWR